MEQGKGVPENQGRGFNIEGREEVRGGQERTEPAGGFKRTELAGGLRRTEPAGGLRRTEPAGGLRRKAGRVTPWYTALEEDFVDQVQLDLGGNNKLSSE